MDINCRTGSNSSNRRSMYQYRAIPNQKEEEAIAKPSSFESNSVRWKASIGTRLKGTVVVVAIKEIQVIEA